MVDHRRIIEALDAADTVALEIANWLRRDHGLAYTPDPIQVLEDAETIITEVARLLENDSPV